MPNWGRGQGRLGLVFGAPGGRGAFIAMIKDGWDHSSPKVMMNGAIHLRALPMNGRIHPERGRDHEAGKPKARSEPQGAGGGLGPQPSGQYQLWACQKPQALHGVP